MVEHYDFVHLSVGDLLRAERAKSPPSENAELIETFLKEGKLVPVSISLALVKEAMEREEEGSVFLIDGFPRNSENLEGWEEIMRGLVDVSCVLVYDCPIAELQRRILERGETSGRSDDNLESAKKRFNTFELETMPTVRKMEKGGVRSIHVRGEKSLEEVWGDTKEAVDKVMSEEVLMCNEGLDKWIEGGQGLEKFVDEGVVEGKARERRERSNGNITLTRFARRRLQATLEDLPSGQRRGVSPEHGAQEHRN